MSQPSWVQRLYWSRFAKPAEERALNKYLLQNPVDSILELGIGNGARMKRLAELARPSSGTEEVRYIGVDAFESSNDGRSHLTLKAAHRVANQLGFKASLIPGEIESAIPRVAHKFGGSQLVIADGCLDPSQPYAGSVGEWLDRLTVEDATIFASNEVGGELVPVKLELAEQRAAA